MILIRFIAGVRQPLSEVELWVAYAPNRRLGPVTGNFRFPRNPLSLRSFGKLMICKRRYGPNPAR